MLPDLAATLRRQLVEHERAAAELREILAGMEGPDFAPAGREPSALNGADVLEQAIVELRERCIERRIPLVDHDGALWVDGKGCASLVGRSALTVRNWRGDERLPCTLIGRAYHYRLEDVARLKIGEAA